MSHTEPGHTLSQIDALITQRILAFYDALIRRGQIPKVSEPGPSLSPQSFGCTPSARTLPDDQQEDPLPPQSGQRESRSCEHARE